MNRKNEKRNSKSNNNRRSNGNRRGRGNPKTAQVFSSDGNVTTIEDRSPTAAALSQLGGVYGGLETFRTPVLDNPNLDFLHDAVDTGTGANILPIVARGLEPPSDDAPTGTFMAGYTTKNYILESQAEDWAAAVRRAWQRENNDIDPDASTLSALLNRGNLEEYLYVALGAAQIHLSLEALFFLAEQRPGLGVWHTLRNAFAAGSVRQAMADNRAFFVRARIPTNLMIFWELAIQNIAMFTKLGSNSSFREYGLILDSHFTERYFPTPTGIQQTNNTGRINYVAVNAALDKIKNFFDSNAKLLNLLAGLETLEFVPWAPNPNLTAIYDFDANLATMPAYFHRNFPLITPILVRNGPGGTKVVRLAHTMNFGANGILSFTEFFGPWDKDYLMMLHTPLFVDGTGVLQMIPNILTAHAHYEPQSIAFLGQEIGPAVDDLYLGFNWGAVSYDGAGNAEVLSHNYRPANHGGGGTIPPHYVVRPEFGLCYGPNPLNSFEAQYALENDVEDLVAVQYGYGNTHRATFQCLAQGGAPTSWARGQGGIIDKLDQAYRVFTGSVLYGEAP